MTPIISIDEARGVISIGCIMDIVACSLWVDYRGYSNEKGSNSWAGFYDFNV